MKTKPSWLPGNNPGKASNIFLVVAIEREGRITYDVVFRRYTRHPDTYSWVDLGVNPARIVGYTPLTALVGWGTGADGYPRLVDGNSRTFLGWTIGEPSDPDQRYIVSLASQYAVQECIAGDWVLPTKKEADCGFEKYIPMDSFLDYIADYLPFAE
ncbi:hypothetical protein ACJJIK_06385 [Microbulbifer sp. ZKSA006]|uniref:hypothetical protein n=1 Tax=Microbulbifer sp. ZKSA006 TaxID=3243390 RepID=UPI004039921B